MLFLARQDKKHIMIIFLLMLLLGIMPGYSISGNCDYPWQTDSIGRRCGGRAASCRPGGRLGGGGVGCPKSQKTSHKLQPAPAIPKSCAETQRLNHKLQDLQRDQLAEIDSLQRELALDDSLKRELLAAIASLKRELLAEIDSLKSQLAKTKKGSASPSMQKDTVPRSSIQPVK